MRANCKGYVRRGMGDRLAVLLSRIGVSPRTWSEFWSHRAIVVGGMNAILIRGHYVEQECGCDQRRQWLNRVFPY